MFEYGTSYEWQGGNKYLFQPETIELSDGTTERMWVNRDLMPVPNKLYQLVVEAEDFPKAESSLILPSAAQTRINVVLKNSSVDSIIVFSSVSYFEQPPKGFMIRLLLEFPDMQSGELVLKRAEVPVDELQKKIGEG